MRPRPLLLVLLLVHGCGPGNVPPELAAPDDATRARGLALAAERQGDDVVEALWKVAIDDANEFLRAKALERLAALRPAGDPPVGARMALLRALRDDPDLNRRAAALLQLHLEGVEGALDAATVWRESANPATRRAVLVGAATLLEPAALTELGRHDREVVQDFAREAARIQGRMRAGKWY